LSRIAASLGSDVPFFLHGASSICRGRGEIVRPISRPKPRWVVLILPGFSVSTPAAYRKFDEMWASAADCAVAASAIATEPDWQAWAELSAGPLLARFINDLEAPSFALCPQLAQLRAVVEQTLGRPVMMSGSGSSLFTLFDQEPEALLAAERINECHRVRAIATELAPQVKDDLRV
jgi:4-diphosphocytidyl-2-C-methyl-D-erythritol kinase